MGPSQRRLAARWSIRLRDYDDAPAGAHLFTIRVQNRRLALGHVVDGVSRLWMEGQIVQEVGDGLEDRFPPVAPDAFVVMPNHVHGIVMLDGSTGHASPDRSGAEGAGATNRAPTRRPVMPDHVPAAAPTLGKVVRVLKAMSTRLIRDVGGRSFGWQRSYYERVIRDERELEHARAHVEAKPGRWAEDGENPRFRR